MLRTEAQRKNICRSCPLSRAADILGDSITIIVINQLLSGERKFGEIEKNLSGVSTRTITLKLRTLEKEGLVEKRKSGRCVIYAIGERGKKMKAVIKEMKKMGEIF